MFTSPLAARCLAALLIVGLAPAALAAAPVSANAPSPAPAAASAAPAGAALAATPAAAPAAAASGSLELSTVAECEQVEIAADGRQRVLIVPAAKVVPGDVVLYRTQYRNRGALAAEQVVIRNPVPAHMRYLAGSAFGPGAQVDFSVDGGECFAAPEQLQVPDGEGGLRPATAADYTHIRWTLTGDLSPGAAGQVGFRAQLQ